MLHGLSESRLLCLQVLVKESEGPVEHPVHLGTAALKLVELRVTSKPAKPKMGKPGRKKKVTVEDLDADEDGGGPADGADTAGARCWPRICDFHACVFLQSAPKRLHLFCW